MTVGVPAQSLSAQQAVAAGTAVDNATVATWCTATVRVQSYQVGDTPTVVNIEGSLDNSRWVQLGQFPAGETSIGGSGGIGGLGNGDFQQKVQSFCRYHRLNLVANGANALVSGFIGGTLT